MARWLALGERVRASMTPQGGVAAGSAALTAARSRAMEAVARTILPRTDAPGAEDAGVSEFVAALVDGWLDPEESERLLAGLDSVDRIARERFRAVFADCAPEERRSVVGDLDEELGAWRDDPRLDAEAHPFHDVKRFALVAYFTSEAGLTALGHRTAFRAFEGCVPLDEAGGAG